MEKAEQIREGLHAMAARFGPAATMIAIVDSVDEVNQLCTLDDDDLLIYEVRLRALITGNENIIIVPKVGSYVLALRLENTEEWMVLACDQIDKIKVVVGNSSFEMDGETFLFKNDVDTLKDLMNDLLQAIQEMVFTTNVGPTINLVNAVAFASIQTRFNNFLNNA